MNQSPACQGCESKFDSCLGPSLSLLGLVMDARQLLPPEALLSKHFLTQALSMICPNFAFECYFNHLISGSGI